MAQAITMLAYLEKAYPMYTIPDIMLGKRQFHGRTIPSHYWTGLRLHSGFAPKHPPYAAFHLPQLGPHEQLEPRPALSRDIHQDVTLAYCQVLLRRPLRAQSS
ncbi:hypothetical protein SCP_0300270 [Sparassis crispa]|uniref:Uncharacterized protein n=1 Tax=Sparassis crispa TaxID=139825 RepID=A0A401GDQ6_9APHY|nr:hypothetical protein SCP_0300270 [Sparassis crispa]GBE80312.1 hypothetical protein SCP_0300270 [Sparassis crispa]